MSVCEAIDRSWVVVELAPTKEVGLGRDLELAVNLFTTLEQDLHDIGTSIDCTLLRLCSSQIISLWAKLK